MPPPIPWAFPNIFRLIGLKIVKYKFMRRFEYFFVVSRSRLRCIGRRSGLWVNLFGSDDFQPSLLADGAQLSACNRRQLCHVGRVLFFL